MAGLLDTQNINPLALGLLGAGGAIMSGRRGLAQAPQAFAGGLMQGQQMQQAQRAAALREQMAAQQMDVQRQQLGLQKDEFGLKRDKQAAEDQAKAGIKDWLTKNRRDLLPVFAISPEAVAKQLMPAKPESPFAKLNPTDYTNESFAAFTQSLASGQPDYSLLKPVRKREFVDGVAVDPYAIPLGTATTNPQRMANDLVTLGPGGVPQVNQVVVDAKARIAKAGAPQVINQGQSGFNNERALRSEFDGSATVKAFNEVRSAHDIIKNALASPSGANDLAAATKFMKLLDPGSVVRESELGMAMAATGLVDRMQNYVQMMASGQKLTPQQRKDFASSADTIYSAARARYANAAKDVRGQAKKWELDPDAVAPAAWKVYGYKSRDEAVRDARNAIMKNPQAKDEVVRRLVEEMDILDHGIR
jgi:hypothetical protein